MSKLDDRIFKIEHLDLNKVAQALIQRTSCPIKIAAREGVILPTELLRVRICEWQYRTNGNFKYEIEGVAEFEGTRVVVQIRYITGEAQDNLSSDIIFKNPGRNPGLDLAYYDFE